jgi:hypothetical protein
MIEKPCLSETLFSNMPYRFAWPRAIFFTLRFAEPRGTVRLAFGAAFFRAARFAFLRSSLLSFLVLAMNALVSLFLIFECNRINQNRESLFVERRRDARVSSP